ncbi:MAG TPA: fibronectin type III domain-containing protein [Bacteroidales bacterium]|nr:fibronectin type III domain-containing protein [Bacteroidales bacterium]
MNAQSTIPARKGWWKFQDPANLTSPEQGYGQPLVLTGSHTAVEGPWADNHAVMIGSGSYYKMNHGIQPNGGGNYVNEYSLMVDFKVPALGVWHSFFQTSVNNGNDGDFFINTTGNIGVAAVGYSDYAIEPDQWYRLVISVKNGNHFTCYLDGKPFLSGITQDIDGRFSLENQLLVFADNDGEDGEIVCAELAIWNQSLTAAQAMELGGYGHEVNPVVMTKVPFLQQEGTNMMTVCWHDIDGSATIVKYGTDSLLTDKLEGTNELIKEPYRWHTVKLTGLQPGTRYYYKVGNGTAFSRVYSFKTLPDKSYTGKLRFILLGDTHCPDSTAVNHVLKTAREKISELYGPDIENHVNGIFHSGDIVVDGSILEQYTTEFLRPISVLSPYLPTMAVAGNHEGENSYFYRYMKLDDYSAFPQNPDLNEKIWSIQAGNGLFIGMNSNITGTYGNQEINWLKSRLNEAEADTSIDFVFLFMHHFPYSELWNVSDESIEWVKNSVVPVLKNFPKVRELHYGHTHGYERGTLLSNKEDGDFNIICGGGGGGGLDPWESSDNHDYNDINKSFSTHFFQVLELDASNHSYSTTVYDVGSEGNWKDGKIMDVIYRKNDQLAPQQPVIENITTRNDSLYIATSEYKGVDSLMSLHLQVFRSNQLLVDTVLQGMNIYGLNQGLPVNRNASVDLNRLALPVSSLETGSCVFKIRYRDHNLKWSEWSADYNVTLNSSDAASADGLGYMLYQNFPNPFDDRTSITYYIPEKSDVNFRIFDLKSSLVKTIDEGMKERGLYTLILKDEEFPTGTLSYQMITSNGVLTRKMVKN